MAQMDLQEVLVLLLVEMEVLEVLVYDMETFAFALVVQKWELL